MPYKEKLKNQVPNPRKKPDYKVTNWTPYNKSLKNRGKLSLLFPPGDIKSCFINENVYVAGVSGRQQTYTDSYIELIYTFYRLFNWGIRQTIGYFEDIWETKNLDIPAPSFGHLSDLFSCLPVDIKQHCDKIIKKIQQGEPVTLIIDSTGLRFDKASHWYEEKYGKPCKNTPWRKMHISIDPQMNMHAIDITDNESSDIEKTDDLIPENIRGQVDKLIADGAYYSIENAEKLHNEGIMPVIPPPSNAVTHGKTDTIWHDKITKYIKEKGTVYAFHKKYGYSNRSLVESQISRIKRCIGSSLKTQKLESQKREGIVIANIINKWNSFGKCSCIKVG